MLFTVRPFRADEAAVLTAIRLEALANSPPAFAERWDVAKARGGEDFERFLAQGTVWGVFDGQGRVGMAGLHRFVGSNVAHKATIWGVYLAPRIRGASAAKQLFQVLFDHALEQGIEVLELGVGDFNMRAYRFYERMGFEPYGLERRAVKLQGRYIDEVLMARRL